MVHVLTEHKVQVESRKVNTTFPAARNEKCSPSLRMSEDKSLFDMF